MCFGVLVLLQHTDGCNVNVLDRKTLDKAPYGDGVIFGQLKVIFINRVSKVAGATLYFPAIMRSGHARY